MTYYRPYPLPSHLTLPLRRLCRDCSENHHNPKTHNHSGCLQTLNPEPFDFVCSCKVSFRPRRPK